MKTVTITLINMKTINGILALIVSIGTAMVGYTIHHSAFWSVVDFFFWPFAWIKWLVCQEVNMTIIRTTFEFLSK
jgi:hypothetical protein